MFLLGTLFFVNGQILAQEPLPDRKPKLSLDDRVNRMTEDLKSRLALSDDQTQQVRALILEREKGRETEMNQRKEQRKRWEDAMTGILNAEQQTAFRKLQEERKARMQEQKRNAHQE